jgi:hypothetical protein
VDQHDPIERVALLESVIANSGEPHEQGVFSMRQILLAGLGSSFFLILTVVAGCGVTDGPADNDKTVVQPAADTKLTPQMMAAECFGCNQGKEWCCTRPSDPNTCYERPCSDMAD